MPTIIPKTYYCPIKLSSLFYILQAVAKAKHLPSIGPI